MNVSEPATVVMSRGTAAVVRVLAGADRAFTGRETARLAGVSHGRAQQALKGLVGHGLVEVQAHRPVSLYSFNRRHVAAGAVEELVRLRSAFLEELRRLIAAWKIPPLHASVFGSMARSDGDTRSDIDLLVVRPAGTAATDATWTAQLHEAVQEVRLLTGNSLSLAEISQYELARLASSNEAMLMEWLVDGIHVAGGRLDNLLRSLT
jgi:predicted nucleotidyltransferase